MSVAEPLLLPSSSVLYNVHDSEHPAGTTRRGLHEFSAYYGAPLHSTSHELLALIDEHHIHGRGGAHFPAARKIQSALDAGGGGAVIANGAEGEPSAAKDAALWQTNPHLVLRGLRSVARIVGSSTLGIWVHDDSFATRRSIEQALRDEEKQLPGHVPITVYLAPHRYVAGEASAVISAVQGGAAVPRFTPSKARAWGSGNAPVLVLNTETLAHIGLLQSALIADYPAPERTLVTVIEPARRTVHEVDTMTTFGGVQEMAFQPTAALLGGYGGAWTTWESIRELPIDHTVLREHGLSLGAGVIGLLPPDVCGLAETARIVAWMADQSAQQCGPCIFGLQWLAEDMAIIAEARGGQHAALKRLRERLPLLYRRGACSHPDGVARLAATALSVFATEVALHARKSCSATYHQPVFPTRESIHA